MASEAIEKMIPGLEERFELNLTTPNISTSIESYMIKSPFEIYLEIFKPIGDYGLLKFCEEYSKNRVTCASLAAHGMGHAAVYQNSNFYEEFKKDELLDALGEGIAQTFQKTGLKILADKFKKNMARKYRSKLIETYVKESILDGFLFLNEYGVGVNILDYLQKRGISIKELITNPLEYKEEIKKNWKKMLKFHTKLAVKTNETLCSILDRIENRIVPHDKNGNV